MSPTLSVVEHLIMVAVILVSLAAMIVLVFLGERPPRRRPHGRDQPDGRDQPGGAPGGLTER